MADAGKDGGKGKWTEEEKNQFFLQLIGQAVAGGTKFTYQKVVLPGRTNKALQNFWEKLRKDALAAFEAVGGDVGSTQSTPAPKSGTTTPGSRKRPAPADDPKESGDKTPATPTPGKRARKAPAKPKAKTKAAQEVPAIDEEELSQGPVKHEIHSLLSFEQNGLPYPGSEFINSEMK
ncbi:hypothetical protein EKO27_g10119 [Xylaria grammica]|uniref:Myb-like domain-containing protein n=1 Tax=Xylaria grammica TaxID=363999 RepID=A0A439CS18_9PEZI|nr:hypothetical protein EKO27_g10119 [Xylaria grammica]